MPVINHPSCPEFMAPALTPPTRVAMNRGDARSDIDALFADQKSAWEFAVAHQLAILSTAADRNGAYLVVAPSKDIYKLFGDECGMWRRHTDGGLTTEHWLGCIGHIRVFWREVKCTAH